MLSSPSPSFITSIVSRPPVPSVPGRTTMRHGQTDHHEARTAIRTRTNLENMFLFVQETQSINDLKVFNFCISMDLFGSLPERYWHTANRTPCRIQKNCSEEECQTSA